MAKLKVFAAPQGFYETVVAAPSQKAALEAWGTHQNLFESGMASVTTDAKAVEAALARPGEVLSRPAGSKDPFKPVGQAAPPKPPKAPPKPKVAKAAAAKPTPRPKPPADRGPLADAEQVLKAAEAARIREIAALQREREELERRIAQTERRLDAEVARAEKARARAEAAFVKAGGRL
jgi:colicin import membrane protein